MPADVIVWSIINEQGARAEIVQRGRLHLLANNHRTPSVKLFGVVESYDLRCTIMQIVIGDRRAALVNGDMHAFGSLLPLPGTAEDCKGRFRQEFRSEERRV